MQMFFDGEEGMTTTSSSDGIYGSTDLAERWAEQEYLAPAQDYCQVQQATYLDRMDLLFLLDLIGTNESDFQEFIVSYESLKIFYTKFNKYVLGTFFSV